MNASKSAFPRILKTSLRILAALTASSMVITKELDPVFIVFFLSLFVLGFATERQERISRFLGKMQPAMAILFFFLAVMDFVYLSRSFLLSIAHFLLILQGLRLLAIRTTRDGMGSVFISSMMLLSASTLSVDWSFFVCLALFLPMAVWCMILITLVLDHQVVAVSSDAFMHETEQKFAVAGLSEQGFPDETNPAWKETLPVARRSTMIAFSAAGFCCAIVFIIFPRLNFRGFHGQFLQPVHRSGFTNQVDLRKGATIFEDESVAMRIEMDPQQSQHWAGYLRGTTMEYFDGRIWSRGGADQPQPFYGVRGLFRLPFDPKKSGRAIHYDIYLESMDMPTLFTASVPTQLWLDRSSILLGPDGSIERWRNDTWRLHYAVDSRVPDRIADSLALTSGVANSAEVAFCRQLPSKFVTPDLQSILKSAIGDARTPLVKAERIATYLQSNYKYSLDLRGAIGDHLLENFILKTREGNCEYFASAMCVLLRMAGIPARVVSGFRAHEWNQRGNYFVVRMKDAHAWVEVFTGDSWRTFDPTPRLFGSSESGPLWFQHFQEAADYLNLRWNRYVLSYDMERQVGLLEKVGSTSRRWTIDLDEVIQKFEKAYESRPGASRISVHIHISPIEGGIVALLLLGLFFMAHRQVKKKSAPWFYQQLLRIMKKKGHKKFAHQTLNEFLEVARPSLGEVWNEAKLVSDTYYSLRFGGDVHSPPVPVERLREALQRLSR